MSQYKVVRASTRTRRISSPDHNIVRRGSWEQCEAMLVSLFNTSIGDLESRWAGTDMLVRIGSSGTMFIVYRIMPDEA